MFTKSKIYFNQKGELIVKRARHTVKREDSESKYILCNDRVTYLVNSGVFCERTLKNQGREEVFCFAYMWGEMERGNSKKFALGWPYKKA